MKSLYWIGGIVAAGLLVGSGVRLLAHGDAQAASATAAAPAAAAAAPTGAPLAGAVPAVTARADAGSTVAGASNGPYKVGDQLQQSPAVTDKP